MLFVGTPLIIRPMEVVVGVYWLTPDQDTSVNHAVKYWGRTITQYGTFVIKYTSQ